MSPRIAVVEPPLPLRDIPLPPPLARLVPPFLPEGQISLLFGKGGAGKSYIALALGLSVASGIRILPGIAPEVVGHVVVLDWEGQRAQWRRRGEMLAASASISIPETLHYAPLQDFEIGKLDLRSVLREIPDLRLVIIDSVEAALGSSLLGGDPNDRVRVLFQELRRTGVAVLLIDHRSKTEGVSPTAYGSVFKQNWARDVWSIDGELGVGTVTLKHEKTNDFAKQPDVSYRAEFSDAVVSFERADVPPRTQSDRLVQYLESVDGTASMDEVMREFTTSEDNVRKIASRSGGRVSTGLGQVMLVTG